MIDKDWYQIENFLDESDLSLLATDKNKDEWSWGDETTDAIPMSSVIFVEKIYAHLGKRYKLTSAKMMSKTLDIGSYKWHSDNQREDGTTIPDIKLTVLIYLSDVPDSKLLIGDSEVDILTGKAVFLKSEIPHKAENPKSKYTRTFLKYTFSDEEA